MKYIKGNKWEIALILVLLLMIARSIGLIL